MFDQQLITLIIRLLEDCLEEEYALEELRSTIRQALRLIGELRIEN